MAGNNGSGTGVKVARPTINVAGQDDDALAQGLLEMLIVETTQGLYRCEASFGNWGSKDGSIDFLYFDRQKLDFGKAFKIKLGVDPIFDGRIMGLEAQFPEGAPPTLCVLAEDRFQDLRMTRRTRTFTDQSDAGVFNQLANDHGLSPSVNVSGPTHQVLAQINQSDLAFMRERARAIDAELWMDGSTLNVKTRANRSSSPWSMTYGTELHEFTALADLAEQHTSLTVSGWDVTGKSALKYEATDSVIANELNGDTSGISILQSALGQRKQAVAHAVPLNSQEAQAAAEAFFKMGARRFVCARGIAETDSRLRVGATIDLKGLGPLFNGKYYVTEVKHIFDGVKGLRTEFVAERPGIGSP